LAIIFLKKTQKEKERNKNALEKVVLTFAFSFMWL